MTDKPTECVECGDPIRQPATARTRYYCSATCRLHAHDRGVDPRHYPPVPEDITNEDRT